ncbi:hypothetical protein [Actinoalloteichus hymeniacidonis]|uniref:Plasmid replication, integration and excision activator n=1 Tax=Actinoalloteichus hymeniacidonis TaxID=340345 RepID=A0AAC9HL39_9PSEU|nr:hypothetical protein [Actinoalloteichus hymeniacidonis]AOS61151.1 hypothetical protein TL08_01560 [Actinoalloteichus hymeniacidonis]MBB5910848.1 hypothetical protein [Actinoalloteichus hymeniacidonis]
MPVPNGYRFSVPFDDVFPDGAFVLGVEQGMDFDNGQRRPAKDKVTGRLVWNVQVTDPAANGRNTGVVVKIAADVQPIPPDALPGTPFRPVFFEGLTATAYEQNGRVAFSLRAASMRAPGAGAGRSSAGKTSQPTAQAAA